MLRGFHAGVCHEQGRFQLFIKGLIDLRASEHGGNAAPGFSKTCFQFAEPSLARRGCQRSRWGQGQSFRRCGLGRSTKETEHRGALG